MLRCAENTPKSLKGTCGDISKTPNYYIQYINPNRYSTGPLENWEYYCIIQERDKSDPGNYRLVSLTSVVGKLMEKIVRKVIVIHMIKNDLYSKKQFGFISGRSTTLQLLLVMEE